MNTFTFKKQKYSLLKMSILLPSLLFSSCSGVENQGSVDSLETHIEQPSPTEFITEYAGGYTVEIDSYKGDAAEIYILKNDGTAKWIWVKNNNGKADIEDETLGTWTARKNFISITCQGKNGPLTEDFEFKNGHFYDTLTGERYLKLNQ